MLVLGSQSKFLDVDLSVRGGTYSFSISQTWKPNLRPGTTLQTGVGRLEEHYLKMKSGSSYKLTMYKHQGSKLSFFTGSPMTYLKRVEGVSI